MVEYAFFPVIIIFIINLIDVCLLSTSFGLAIFPILVYIMGEGNAYSIVAYNLCIYIMGKNAYSIICMALFEYNSYVLQQASTVS